MLNIINEYLELIHQKKINPKWIEKKSEIVKEFNNFKKIIEQENPPHIYGVTSQVGHMDYIKISNKEINKFQYNIINNHSLNIGFDNYNQWESRCIIFCKIQTYSNGGSAISPTLYENLIDLYSSTNLSIKIPTNSSYSCGDVIPGAFFAKSVVNYLNKKNKKLYYKDGVSLINGNYIQLGLTVSIIPSLDYLLNELIDNSIQYFSVSKANTQTISPLVYNKGWINSLCIYLNQIIPESKTLQQDAVSIRSIPQGIDLINDSIYSLKKVVFELLGTHSDNPLVLGDSEIFSNSSFFSPKLSIMLESVINSLLFIAWQIEKRIHFLLSGNFEKIPLNGSYNVKDLGLIQVPKLITSILEEVRLTSGKRNFASNGSTSYGIEDIWTNAIFLIKQINHISDGLFKILLIEKEIFKYLEENNFDHFKENIIKINQQNISKQYHNNFKHISNINKFHKEESF